MKRDWEKLSKIAWGIAAAVFVGTVAALLLLTSQLREARETIAESEIAAARLDSQVKALSAAARENVQFLHVGEETGRALSTICEIGANSADTGLLTICANRSLFRRTEFFGPTLIAETEAAAARGAGEFELSIRKYGTAEESLQKIEEYYDLSPQEFDLRRMMYLEGQAYGQFRSGNLDQARGLIESALEIGQGKPIATSGFVYATHLKISCASEREGFAAQELYSTYLADLQQALTNAKETDQRTGIFKQFWIEMRQSDLADFESDRELKIVCTL